MPLRVPYRLLKPVLVLLLPVLVLGLTASTPRPVPARSVQVGYVRGPVGLVISPEPFQVGSRPWRDIATYAEMRIEQADNGQYIPQIYAYLALTRARLYGWSDPKIVTYLNRIRALRNPDGGYGLNFVYEQTATLPGNPPDTTYAITTTEHVGRLLLGAYEAGLVSRSEIDRVIDVLVHFPRVAHGSCVAYSTGPRDRDGQCIYNPTGGVTWFLYEATQLGFHRPGMAELFATMRATNRRVYDARTGSWTYSNMTTGPTDVSHSAVNLEALVRTDPTLGVAGVSKRFAMFDPAHRTPDDVEGYTRMLPFRCDLAASFVPVTVEELRKPLGIRLFAQIMWGAARTDGVCAEHQPDTW